MAKIIIKEKEPITPFIDRVRPLYEQWGISTVIVAGSSGAYFSIADKIIQMDNYKAVDITDKVRDICVLKEAISEEKVCLFRMPKNQRNLSLKPLERKKGQLKAKQYSIDSFAVGNETLELRGLEQLKDYEQTASLAHLTKYTLEKMEQGKESESVEHILDTVWKEYEEKGLDGILKTQNLPADFAKIRKQDYYACFYRYRGFTRRK